MNGKNIATLIGNLAADPTLRYTQSGQAVCNLRLITNTSYKNKDGERVEKSEGHNVVVFGKAAESCGNHLEKGRKVRVKGRIQHRRYEDKQGVRRQVSEVVTRAVGFMSAGGTSVNEVTLRGNLGGDITLRHTRGGTPVCNIRLATNSSYKDKQGKRVQQTTWHDVVVFGKQAESCATYLGKGDEVELEGSMRTRSYQDKDGVTRYGFEVLANSVSFLNTSKAGRGEAAPEPSGELTEQPPAGAPVSYEIPY